MSGPPLSRLLRSKPRGVPRGNDRQMLKASFGFCVRVRRGVICQTRVKQARRVVTRYDKLTANYLAFVQLASIKLWLRFK